MTFITLATASPRRVTNGGSPPPSSLTELQQPDRGNNRKLASGQQIRCPLWNSATARAQKVKHGKDATGRRSQPSGSARTERIGRVAPGRKCWADTYGTAELDLLPCSINRGGGLNAYVVLM
eukprot:GHVU01077836.1.p1 GENE.GHVU01077836.1~~GHVU01077836.1.p1  ORF type:complete len:122 (-),score=8.80 GHVU01077836.1:390-755(-)